jgi:hypothetical protein
MKTIFKFINNAREERMHFSKSFQYALLSISILFYPLMSSADVVDFEKLSDSEIVTNQYADLSFSNAIVLSSGLSLNDAEFPPYSGSNVAFDNNGSMAITFSSSVKTVGGYFTYLEPITLIGYNTSNQPVAAVSSLFSTNTALTGDAGSHPNEYLSVSFASGISKVTITGNPNGSSFALDNLTVVSSVDEPSIFMMWLLGTGLVGFRVRHKK